MKISPILSSNIMALPFTYKRRLYFVYMCIFKNLFIYLAVLGLGFSTQNLSSPIRNWTHIPCIAKWILNHWTTREVPGLPVYTACLACLPSPFVTPPISHSAPWIAVHKSILKSCLILLFSPEVKVLTSQYFLECPFTLLKDPTSSCAFKSVHPANITWVPSRCQAASRHQKLVLPLALMEPGVSRRAGGCSSVLVDQHNGVQVLVFRSSFLFLNKKLF